MSDLLTWTINGLDLDNLATYGLIVEPAMWRPPITVRLQSLEIPGRHGELSPGLPVFEAPLLTLSVWRTGTQAAIEEATNALIATLNQPSITLARESGGLVTTAVARLASMSFEGFVVGSTSRATAVLRIPGVFFRTAAQVGSESVFSANLTNVAVPHLAGSTAPITDAVIRITGPCTNPSITDPTTGTGISWTGTVPAGEYLFLRPERISAVRSTTDSTWLSGGIGANSGVDFPAAGPLQLWPMVDSFATRTIRFSATGTGRSGATRLTIRAGRSYL